jgi:uncharacterized membrane protein YcaP (DUF421 family)
MDKEFKLFDWNRFFITHDLPVSYLWEISVRTIVMFLFLIIILKFLSKRGVKQLSVFELAILIALGSATGDPMFYHHVPVLYGFIVLIVVIILYRLITYFTGKSKKMEILLEGKPVCLLENGRINYKNYKKVGLPYDKFFGELRLKSINHLGEVKKVYLETSGEMSIYKFRENEARSGLSIFPEEIENAESSIKQSGLYACIYCGNIKELIPGNDHSCEVCEKNKWIKAEFDIS